LGMAAGRHINPNQLRMFIPAREIRDTIPINDGELNRKWEEATRETPDEMWDRKLEESHENYEEEHGDGYTHYESINNEGVTNPVKLVAQPGKPIKMGHGYHRVAAAADQGKEVPVEYRSNAWEAITSDQGQEWGR
jgi:hypothetical protein